MSTYSDKLQALKANPNIRLRDIGDEWRTPDELYWGIYQLYGPFVLDLFTDGQNSKCANYYTAADNALVQPWAAWLDGSGAAFGNPPYSRSSYDEHNNPVTGMRHIITKAEVERELGARIVFLVKVATSETWWPEHADHICWIRGRVGFELPLWASHLEGSSAGFGQAIVVFDRHWRGERERYIERGTLERQGRQLMNAIEQRARELAKQMASPLPPCSNQPQDHPGTGQPMTEVATLEDEQPVSGSPEQLWHHYQNDDLKADNWHLFLCCLVVLFGLQQEYSHRQVCFALTVEDQGGENDTAAGLIPAMQHNIASAHMGLRCCLDRLKAIPIQQQAEAIAHLVASNEQGRKLSASEAMAIMYPHIKTEPQETVV